MARRRYLFCKPCNGWMLVSGLKQRGDKQCSHRLFNREAATPTVYYENAKGEVWSGPDANTPCPLQGYNRVEVQPHEIRKFERLMGKRMQKEHRERIEAQREMSEYHAKLREDARRELDAEVLKESEGWTPEQREFLDYAMTHRNEPQYSRGFEPDFFVGAYN